jgi:hypothetical protein
MSKYKLLIGHTGDPSRGHVIVVDKDIENPFQKIKEISDGFNFITSRNLSFLEDMAIDSDPEHLFEKLVEEDVIKQKLKQASKAGRSSKAGSFNNHKRLKRE